MDPPISKYTPLYPTGVYPDEDTCYRLCLVFKVGDKIKSITAERGVSENELTCKEFDHFEAMWSNVTSRLVKSGLTVTLFKSKDEKDVFCYVKADEARIKVEAERIGWELELDPGGAEKRANELKIQSKHYDHIRRNNITGVWHSLYAPFLPNYDRFENREKIYKTHKYGSIFRTIDYIKLLYIIINSPIQVNGCNLNLQSLCQDPKHPLIAHFPLHEEKELQLIKKICFRCHRLKKLPLREIRDYFGEQISMYFAFAQFYTYLLIVPSFLGIISYVSQLYSKKINIGETIVFGLFISIWPTIFLEAWKQREIRLRTCWGMTNYITKEKPRASFRHDSDVSISERLAHFRNETKVSMREDSEKNVNRNNNMCLKSCASHMVILSFIGVAIVFLIAIKLYRTWLEKSKSFSITQSSYISSIVTAIGIYILNKIYSKVARIMNDLENHKTDSSYENAIIVKNFVFKAVNSYNPLVYVAFLQKYDSSNPCSNLDPTCLGHLRESLGVIFLTQVILKNLEKIILPWIKKKLSSRPQELAKGVTSGEKDYYLRIAYDNPILQYSHLAINFGYSTLFVLALPITPLFVLLDKLLQKRDESYMLFHIYRRPRPRGAHSIGAWYSVFEVLSYLTVLSNVALITISGDFNFFFSYSWTKKLVTFILVEHILILVKFSMSYLISQFTNEEKLFLQQQNYIANVLLNGEKEEEEKEEEEKEDDDFLPGPPELKRQLTSFQSATQNALSAYAFEKIASNFELSPSSSQLHK